MSVSGPLHMITTYNYITEVKQNRNILHTVFNPLLEFDSRTNLNLCVDLANQYWGLQLRNPVMVWNYAKQIHDDFERLLEGSTFFDECDA